MSRLTNIPRLWPNSIHVALPLLLLAQAITGKGAETSVPEANWHYTGSTIPDVNAPSWLKKSPQGRRYFRQWWDLYRSAAGRKTHSLGFIGKTVDINCLTLFAPTTTQLYFERCTITVPAGNKPPPLPMLQNLVIKDSVIDPNVAASFRASKQLHELMLTRSTILESANVASQRERTQLRPSFDAFLDAMFPDQTTSRGQRVDLTGTAATHAGVGALVNRGHVTSWSLADTSCDDQVLAAIDASGRVHSLSLRNTRVTSQGLLRCQSLAKMKELDLSGTAIDDSAIPALATTRQLDRFSIANTKLSAAVLPVLGNSYYALYLDNLPITDEDMDRMLARTDWLLSLSLAGCQTTDRTVRRLAQWQGLKHLDCSRCSVSKTTMIEYVGHERDLGSVLYLTLKDMPFGAEGFDAVLRATPANVCVIGNDNKSNYRRRQLPRGATETIELFETWLLDGDSYFYLWEPVK